MKYRFYNPSLINMTDSTAVIINGANSTILFRNSIWFSSSDLSCLCAKCKFLFMKYIFSNSCLIKFTRFLDSVTILHLWSSMSPIQQFHVAFEHSFLYQIHLITICHLDKVSFCNKHSLITKNHNIDMCLYIRFSRLLKQ